jgi:hypothetical protein
MSDRMGEEPRFIPFEQLDEETRREVIKTRRVIMLVGFGSIGLIVLLTVGTIVAVLIHYFSK